MSKRWIAASLTALTALALAAPAVAQQSRHVAKPTVTAKVSTVDTLVHHKVVIKGHVSKARKGDRVILQKRILGKKTWKTEERGKLNSTKHYKFTDKPTTPETRDYRVKILATKKHTATHSKKRTVVVRQWRPLTTWFPFSAVRKNDGFYFWNHTATINTVVYPHSVVGSLFQTAGSIDLNIAGRCSALRSRFGVGDNTDETASALITVTADGKNLYSKSFALRQSEQKSLSLGKAFRLAFSYQVTDPADSPGSPEGAVAVLASPEILCTK